MKTFDSSDVKLMGDLLEALMPFYDQTIEVRICIFLSGSGTTFNLFQVSDNDNTCGSIVPGIQVLKRHLERLAFT